MNPVRGANSRALLTFHHILSSRKKRTIRNAAPGFEVYGICKVGYPGILAVEGTEEKVEKYVRKIKSWRWATGTFTNLTTGLSEKDLRMVEARNAASEGPGVEMLEKMSQVGEYMRKVGLEDWWRNSMKYKRGPD